MKEAFFRGLLFLIPASFIERITRVPMRLVQGTVFGSDDLLPIGGIMVAIQGSHTSTVTDADGTFYLHVPEGSVLLFQAPGYQPHVLKLSKQLSQTITLKRFISTVFSQPTAPAAQRQKSFAFAAE